VTRPVTRPDIEGILSHATGPMPWPWMAQDAATLAAYALELEATLAAERGDAAGALPGWTFYGSAWFNAEHDISVQRIEGSNRRPVAWRYPTPNGERLAPTARAAMKAATLALTTTPK
jgi:hypothetical protein